MPDVPWTLFCSVVWLHPFMPHTSRCVVRCCDWSRSVAAHKKGKKNCADNPNCLYGFGEHKEGIWSSAPQAVLALGVDLRDSLYADEDHPPSGLENMGATCYLNTLLQCLFMNTGFRGAVFDYEPDAAGEPPEEIALDDSALAGAGAPSSPPGGIASGEDARKSLKAGKDIYSAADDVEMDPGGEDEVLVSVPQAAGAAAVSQISIKRGREHMRALQVLFAQMQESRRKYVSPSHLVSLLRIKSGIQQDVHEFYKVFLHYVEEQFARATLARVRNSVQQLFRGEMVYITRCLHCDTESHSVSPFYELELQTRKLPDIQSSIKTMLAQETMEGTEQYYCGNCSAKQDATRHLELRKLPEVLSLALVRYTYDRKTWTRVKLQDTIAIPNVLNISQLTSEARAGYLTRGGDGGASGTGAAGCDLAGGMSAGTAVDDEEGDVVYELSSVLYHKGNSTEVGHYFADVWDPVRGAWFRFDDTTVTEIEYGEVDQAGIGTGNVPRVKSNGTATKGKAKGKAKAKTKGKGGKRGKSKAEGAGKSQTRSKRRQGSEGAISDSADGTSESAAAGARSGVSQAIRTSSSVDPEVVDLVAGEDEAPGPVRGKRKRAPEPKGEQLVAKRMGLVGDDDAAASQGNTRAFSHKRTSSTARSASDGTAPESQAVESDEAYRRRRAHGELSVCKGSRAAYFLTYTRVPADRVARWREQRVTTASHDQIGSDGVDEVPDGPADVVDLSSGAPPPHGVAALNLEALDIPPPMASGIVSSTRRGLERAPCISQDWLRSAVERSDADVRAKVQEYSAKRVEVDAAVDKRKSTYKTLFEEAAPFVEEGADEFVYVDADWLRRWCIGEDQDPPIPKARRTRVKKLAGTETTVDLAQDEARTHSGDPSAEANADAMSNGGVEEIDLTADDASATAAAANGAASVGAAASRAVGDDAAGDGAANDGAANDGAATDGTVAGGAAADDAASDHGATARSDAGGDEDGRTFADPRVTDGSAEEKDGSPEPVADSGPKPVVFNKSMDMTKFLCTHRPPGIPPEKIAQLKRISVLTYDQLRESGAKLGDVTVDHETYLCKECLSTFTKRIQETKDRETTLRRLLHLLKEAQQSDVDDPDGYYIAKSFIRALNAHVDTLNRGSGTLHAFFGGNSYGDGASKDAQRKAKAPLPTEPADGLLCEHGNLRPGRSVKILVPKMVYDELRFEFDAGPEFPVGSDDCEMCLLEDADMKAASIEERGKRQLEISIPAAKRLLTSQKSGFPIPRGETNGLHLDPGTFFLVGHDWLESWRSFVRDTSSPRPGMFSTEAELGCRHGRLLPPHHVVSWAAGEGSARSLLIAKEVNKTAASKVKDFEVISEEQADHLTELKHEFPEGLAKLIIPTDGLPTWEWRGDGICEDCTKERSDLEAAAALEFQNKVVYIEVLRAGEEPPAGSSTVSGDASSTAVVRRSTRRARQRGEVVVSSSDDVHLLKMKIFSAEIGGVTNLNSQRLYCEGRLLEPSRSTLSSHNVKAGSTVYLRRVADEDTSLEDDIAAYSGKGGSDRDAGFGGTAMAGGSGAADSSVWSCSACTVANEAGALVCAVCGCER